MEHSFFNFGVTLLSCFQNIYQKMGQIGKVWQQYKRLFTINLEKYTLIHDFLKRSGCCPFFLHDTLFLTT